MSLSLSYSGGLNYEDLYISGQVWNTEDRLDADRQFAFRRCTFIAHLFHIQ